MQRSLCAEFIRSKRTSQKHLDLLFWAPCLHKNRSIMDKAPFGDTSLSSKYDMPKKIGINTLVMWSYGTAVQKDTRKKSVCKSNFNVCTWIIQARHVVQYIRECSYRWNLKLFDFGCQKPTKYIKKCHFWATLGVEKAISGINLRVKTDHFVSACTRILSFWTILFLVWYGKSSRSHDKAIKGRRPPPAHFQNDGVIFKYYGSGLVYGKNIYYSDSLPHSTSLKPKDK